MNSVWKNQTKVKELELWLEKVKAATGEEVSAEDLGGADLHCRYKIKIFSQSWHVWTLITVWALIEASARDAASD